MPALAILRYPDPRLRLKAVPVVDFDDAFRGFVDDLVATLHAHGGIGLAATQVGDLRQVLVTDLSGTASAPEVYVNPVILSRSVSALVEESCLSIPGIVGNVVRSIKLRVRAQDPHGTVFERDLEDMHAVCLQHEIDHLEGRLFIDRLSLLRRLWIKARTPKPVAA